MKFAFFYRLPTGITLWAYIKDVHNCGTKFHGHVTGLVGVLELELPGLLRRRTPAFFVPCDPSSAVARSALLKDLINIAESWQYGMMMNACVKPQEWKELTSGLRKSLIRYGMTTLVGGAVPRYRTRGFLTFPSSCYFSLV